MYTQLIPSYLEPIPIKTNDYYRIAEEQSKRQYEYELGLAQATNAYTLGLQEKSNNFELEQQQLHTQKAYEEKVYNQRKHDPLINKIISGQFQDAQSMAELGILNNDAFNDALNSAIDGDFSQLSNIKNSIDSSKYRKYKEISSLPNNYNKYKMAEDMLNGIQEPLENYYIETPMTQAQKANFEIQKANLNERGMYLQDDGTYGKDWERYEKELMLKEQSKLNILAAQSLMKRGIFPDSETNKYTPEQLQQAYKNINTTNISDMSQWQYDKYLRNEVLKGKMSPQQYELGTGKKFDPNSTKSYSNKAILNANKDKIPSYAKDSYYDEVNNQIKYTNPSYKDWESFKNDVIKYNMIPVKNLDNDGILSGPFDYFSTANNYNEIENKAWKKAFNNYQQTQAGRINNIDVQTNTPTYQQYVPQNNPQTNKPYRTESHNNPTAFTTDIANQAGLVKGIDYESGDSFDNGKYNTAKILKDPINTTIKVIDNIGFYNSQGQQRWNHTAMSDQEWNKLNKEQKTQIIQEMYNKETPESGQGIFQNQVNKKQSTELANMMAKRISSNQGYFDNDGFYYEKDSTGEFVKKNSTPYNKSTIDYIQSNSDQINIKVKEKNKIVDYDLLLKSTTKENEDFKSKLEKENKEIENVFLSKSKKEQKELMIIINKNDQKIEKIEWAEWEKKYIDPEKLKEYEKNVNKLKKDWSKFDELPLATLKVLTKIPGAIYNIPSNIRLNKKIKQLEEKNNGQR